MLGTPVALAVLIGASLVASACGGSSKSGSTSTATSLPAAASTPTSVAIPPPPRPIGKLQLASGKPLTRTQWIAKGDAICTRTNTKVSAISATTTADYARTLPQIAVYVRLEAKELSKLVPPRSMRRDWSSFVYGLVRDSQYIDTAALNAALFAQGKHPKREANAVIKANELHAKLDEIVKRDGFSECSHARVRRGG